MSRAESVGALEAAARQKALDRISKIIQRPDQLEKVNKHKVKLSSTTVYDIPETVFFYSNYRLTSIENESPGRRHPKKQCSKQPSSFNWTVFALDWTF
jgi:hypothetical protein